MILGLRHAGRAWDKPQQLVLWEYPIIPAVKKSTKPESSFLPKPTPPYASPVYWRIRRPQARASSSRVLHGAIWHREDTV